MGLRRCLHCGRLQGDGSYCAGHHPDRLRPRPSRSTPGRGSGRQVQRFRTVILARAGFRCEGIIDGRRCEVTGGPWLQAHHIVPVRVLLERGDDPQDVRWGRAACRSCHEAHERELDNLYPKAA
jgi:hypothetical protein